MGSFTISGYIYGHPGNNCRLGNKLLHLKPVYMSTTSIFSSMSLILSGTTFGLLVARSQQDVRLERKLVKFFVCFCFALVQLWKIEKYFLKKTKVFKHSLGDVFKYVTFIISTWLIWKEIELTPLIALVSKDQSLYTLKITNDNGAFGFVLVLVSFPSFEICKPGHATNLQYKCIWHWNRNTFTPSLHTCAMYFLYSIFFAPLFG